MTRDPYLWCCIAVIGLVYAISFFLPVVDMEGLEKGWQVFVAFSPLIEASSLRGRFGNIFLWSPNPLLWVGVVCLAVRRPHFALVAGAVATGSAGFTLYSVNCFDVEVLHDFWEAISEICGAYLWFISMVMLFMVALVFTIKQWRQTRSLSMLGEAS